MAGEPYKITIEGPGISVTREVEEKTAFSILSIALGNKSGSGLTEQEASISETNTGDEKSTPSSETTTNDVSIGEFMADLKIGNNVERIAAVALYLKDVQGSNRMKKDEVTDWFQKAGLVAPKNLPRDIQSAVKKRLIAEDNNDSERYFVTQTGERTLRATD